MTAQTEALRALAPCPFCASSDIVTTRGARREYPWVVFCEGCGIHTDEYRAIHQAMDAWNNRATLPAEAGSAGAVEVVAPIQRFYYTSDDGMWEDPTPDEDSWVRATDYDALQSTLTRQQAENEGLREECERAKNDASMWRGLLDQAQTTIKMQRDFAGALSNEMRAAGCKLDETPKVVNVRAEAAESERDRWKSEYATLADRSVEEQARVGELEADARRWRFVRQWWGHLYDVYVGEGPEVDEVYIDTANGWPVDPATLDAAIDKLAEERADG